MEKIFLFGLLLIATSAMAFELPMVFDIGAFGSEIPRIHHQIQAAGPFVTMRNVTFSFEWETPDYTIHGLRVRGTEPRYDRVSVTVRALNKKSYAVDVTVINTNFVLFWCEPHGYEDISPLSKEKIEN